MRGNADPRAHLRNSLLSRIRIAVLRIFKPTRKPTRIERIMRRNNSTLREDNRILRERLRHIQANTVTEEDLDGLRVALSKARTEIKELLETVADNGKREAALLIKVDELEDKLDRERRRRAGYQGMVTRLKNSLKSMGKKQQGGGK